MTRPDLQLPITLGTHRFAIDFEGFRYQTVAAMREMVDQGVEAGEQSFSNVGIFKRSGQDFVGGAGQPWFDLIEESDRKRWRTSKGIDPWDRRSLKLLRATELCDIDFGLTDGDFSGSPEQLFGIGENLFIIGQMHAGSLYVLQHNFDDDTSSNTILGSVSPTASTTDGQRLWLTQGEFGSGATIELAGESAPWSLGASDLTNGYEFILYANGRLIAGSGPDLYELDAALVPQTGPNLFTHPDSEWHWHAGCSAPNAIYVAGGTDDLCEIYKIGVNDTGGLDVPVHALSLPLGEITRVLLHYGGLICLGTSRGIRLAGIDGSGFLTHGPVIEIDEGVHHLLGRGEFVWFSWMDFDETSSGLGRLNLARFTDSLVPAYASDLMAATTGEVSGIAHADDRLWFGTDAVSGSLGLWCESDAFEANGTYRSGKVDFGTPERKRFTSLEVAATDMPVGASVTYGVTDDDGDDQTVGVMTTRSSSARITPGIEGECSEVWLTLDRGDAEGTPDVNRWTLRALPLPKRIAEIYLPLILHRRVEAQRAGSPVGQSEWDKWEYLQSLVDTREIVELRFGNLVIDVFVDQLYLAGQDTATKIMDWNQDRSWLEATWIAKLVTVEGQ